MKKNLPWVFGLCAALCLSVACGGSSDGGSGGSGGDSGGSGGSAGGGGTSGGSGGKATGGGGGSASGGMSGGMSIALDDYPAAIGTAQCAALTKCCMNMDANCVKKKQAIFLPGLKTLRPSIEAKKVEYDGAKLAECLAKLTALACDAKQGDVDAYRDCQYLKGTVANGSDCASGTECKEGYCDKPDATMPGKCTAKKDNDAACKGDDQCKGGLCKKAMTTDVEGKCAVAEAPKAGVCGALPAN